MVYQFFFHNLTYSDSCWIIWHPKALLLIWCQAEITYKWRAEMHVYITNMLCTAVLYIELCLWLDTNVCIMFKSRFILTFISKGRLLCSVCIFSLHYLSPRSPNRDGQTLRLSWSAECVCPRWSWHYDGSARSPLSASDCHPRGCRWSRRYDPG